jgi:hypothetical protein
MRFGSAVPGALAETLPGALSYCSLFVLLIDAPWAFLPRALVSLFGSLRIVPVPCLSSHLRRAIISFVHC